METMNYENKRWEEFLCRLEGYEGCNFREKEPGNSDSVTWRCCNTDERPLARKILESMGDIDIEESFKFFDERGGYCDCEILFNVAR